MVATTTCAIMSSAAHKEVTNTLLLVPPLPPILCPMSPKYDGALDDKLDARHVTITDKHKPAAKQDSKLPRIPIRRRRVCQFNPQNGQDDAGHHRFDNQVYLSGIKSQIVCQFFFRRWRFRRTLIRIWISSYSSPPC